MKTQQLKRSHSWGFRRQREKVAIQVGIDFGTSSTKVAYRQIGGRGKSVRPIIFRHNLPHYPRYCLPTIAAFDKSLNLHFGSEAVHLLRNHTWNMGLRRFKILVAGDCDNSFRDVEAEQEYNEYLVSCGKAYDDYKPHFLAVAFLVLVMRQARQIIQKDFRNSEIVFSFNICMPIDFIENNPVSSVYEKIIATAELTDSNCRENVSPEILLAYIKEHYEDGVFQSNESRRVFFVPESIAETASYFDSLHVQEGLHAVIDFGAGTTDISIFNLCDVKKANAHSYWYATRNLPQGMQQIRSIIAAYLEQYHGNNGHRVNEQQVTELFEKNFSRIPKPIREKASHRLKQIWKESACVWRQAYSHVRNQNAWDVHANPPVYRRTRHSLYKDHRVDIYICGGGANVRSVKEIFQHNPNTITWGPYPIRSLPEPDDYDSLKEKAPFSRLSVAYGLTIPIPSLQQFTLPKDSPDHTPVMVYNHRESLDSDLGKDLT